MKVKNIYACMCRRRSRPTDRTSHASVSLAASCLQFLLFYVPGRRRKSTHFIKSKYSSQANLQNIFVLYRRRTAFVTTEAHTEYLRAKTSNKVAIFSKLHYCTHHEKTATCKPNFLSTPSSQCGLLTPSRCFSGKKINPVNARTSVTASRWAGERTR